MPESKGPSVIGIASNHVALQLALTGMHVEEVTNAEEAEAVLADCLATTAEMIVVQEEFLEGFSALMKEQLERRRSAPLVTLCPSFEAEDSDIDSYLSAVLKPAIGYEMRLE